MILNGLMALQLAGTTSMHVGAAVVRPAPRPAVTIERGRVVVRAAEGVSVGAEGGRLTREPGGAMVVLPEGRLVRIVLTY